MRLVKNKKEGVIETKPQYPVRLEVDYPEKLARTSTFFRILLGIPHVIALFFLSIAQGIVIFFAWWMILFNGRYPKGMFDFVAKVLRWQTRFNAYSMLLTSKYPPLNGNTENITSEHIATETSIQRTPDNIPTDHISDETSFQQPTEDEILTPQSVEIPLSIATPGFFKRNLFPPLVAVLGGLLGIAGAAFQESRQGFPSAIFAPFLAAPIIEESLKPVGVYILLAKAPHLLRSRLYTAFLSALGGLSFAVIENLVYLNIYFPEHTESMIVARFALALPMHVLTSFILGFGINQRLMASVRGEVPLLSGNWKFFIIAMVIHSLYNISAVFWGRGLK